MSDEIDNQLTRDAPWDESAIKRVREQAAMIPVGKPGECDLCGEWSGRLVNGACAPCRDLYKLP